MFVIRPLVATSTWTDVALRYVLDTSVLSEPMRPVPDPEVIKRITQAHDTIATASPVWHEIEFGRLRLPAGKRRRAAFDARGCVPPHYRQRACRMTRGVAE